MLPAGGAMTFRKATVLGICTLFGLACGGGGDAPSGPPGSDNPDGRAPTVTGGTGSSGTAGTAGTNAGSTAGGTYDAGPPRACPTTFRFVPPSGKTYGNVVVTGEWTSFSPGGVKMTGPDAQGAYTATVDLSPGLVAYKLVLDGQWELDPAGAYRKYVGGVENSAVRVLDCRAPTLRLGSKSLQRPAPGQGRFHATVAVHPGTSGAPLDPSKLKVTLRTDDGATPVSGVVLDSTKGEIGLDLPSLADGKYTVMVEATDQAGMAAKALRLPFWVEAEAFEWRDALIYMVMTDRFKDGNPANNPPATAGADRRADWYGGDLDGVRQAVESGKLDELGVRALWISPFNTNPQGTFKAGDGVTNVTGYHGYWPVKAREVEPRIGGEQALRALVKAAHAHGIRILQDYVVNHVHIEHEYFKAHPEWFRTGCVCGTSACDWTDKRLECLFTSYMPDINWSVPEAAEQFVDDAVWWLDTFDLDGLRVDAVKHVEDAAVLNMSTRVRDEFEAAGNRVFLTGETAMGWSDCGLACNDGQYGTISRYVGPQLLDGQFDFVLYHAVPYRVFASDEKGMLHADYWAQASLWKYPQGAVMTPYFGSHDTARFISIATPENNGRIGNQWSNVAVAPTTSQPYERHRLAMAWTENLPGAPLLYYGDEYGEWGGADPNNRAMWRGDHTNLSDDEKTTLATAKKLGQARRELVALRRGDYKSVYATEEVLVFARTTTTGEVALVALNKAGVSRTFTATLPVSVSIPGGVTLRDRLGGNSVVVTSGGITVTLPARSAAVFAP